MLYISTEGSGKLYVDDANAEQFHVSEDVNQEVPSKHFKHMAFESILCVESLIYCDVVG